MVSKLVRHIFFGLSVLVALFVLVFSCAKTWEDEPTAPVVESVVFPESLELTVGDRGSLAVGFLPEDAEDGRITSVSSSDESVLLVSADEVAISFEAVTVGYSEVLLFVGSASLRVAVTVSLPGERMEYKRLLDVRVPEDCSLPIKGGAQRFPLVPVPSDIAGLSLSSLKSEDEGVVKASPDSLAVVLEPVYVGDSDVSFSIGSFQKSFPVHIVGSVVTGISVPDVIDGGTVGRGETLSGRITVVPPSAFDAGTLSVEALNPDIVSFAHDDSWRCTFRGEAFGTAWFEATAGRDAHARWSVTVPESVYVGRTSGADPLPWWDAAEFSVGGDNLGWDVDVVDGKGASLVGSGCVAFSRIDDRLYLRNTSHLYEDVDCAVVARTELQGVESRFSFVLTGADGRVSFRNGGFLADALGADDRNVVFDVYNQTSGDVRVLGVDGFIYTNGTARFLAECGLASLETALQETLEELGEGKLEDFQYRYHENLHWDGEGDPDRSVHDYRVSRAFSFDFTSVVQRFSALGVVCTVKDCGDRDLMGFGYVTGGAVLLRVTLERDGESSYVYYRIGY